MPDPMPPETDPYAPLDESPPGQVAATPPRANRPSVVGRIVVLLMCAMGVVAGSIAVWYWTTQVKQVDSTERGGDPFATPGQPEPQAPDPTDNTQP